MNNNLIVLFNRKSCALFMTIKSTIFSHHFSFLCKKGVNYLQYFPPWISICKWTDSTLEFEIMRNTFYLLQSLIATILRICSDNRLIWQCKPFMVDSHLQLYTVERLRLRLQICLNLTPVSICLNFGLIVYFIETQAATKDNWNMRLMLEINKRIPKLSCDAFVIDKK